MALHTRKIDLDRGGYGKTYILEIRSHFGDPKGYYNWHLHFRDISIESSELSLCYPLHTIPRQVDKTNAPSRPLNNISTYKYIYIRSARRICQMLPIAGYVYNSTVAIHGYSSFRSLYGFDSCTIHITDHGQEVPGMVRSYDCDS